MSLNEVTIDEDIFLIEDTTVKDGTVVDVILTFKDKKAKSIFTKKDNATITDSEIKYEFKIEDVANNNDFDAKEVDKVIGGIDIDNDDIISKHEEAVLQVVKEKEVKITVIVELPHSKETGWGAKGLAGHTAMAIDEKFFDYGPDYDIDKSFSEAEYQADLNKDGDMLDTVKIEDIEASYYFAPGRPWWGEMLSKNPETVTLAQVNNFILKDWKQNNVYGTVYSIEFYVSKSDGQKMEDWWINRYKHLKVYSVEPWTGEQCTTTVKEALAEGGITKIDWNTLTPDGILEDFKTEVKSTSFQHKDEKAIVTLIKKEAIDWKSLN